MGLCLVLGCHSAGEGRFAVRGTVVDESGKPVTGEMATIVFVPDSASSATAPPKSASGTLAPDGSFSLMTDQPHDGADAGDYRVVLKVWSNYREQKLAIPRRYTEAETTPLRAQVGAGSTEFLFTVEP